MAWGRSKPQVSTPPPPRGNIILQLLPLIISLIVLSVIGYVVYEIYQSSRQIGHAYKDKMQKKNVVLTRDGMKVGVKEIRQDRYVDKTQSLFVKAWNLSTWPAYKSRFWNKEQPDTGKKSS